LLLRLVFSKVVSVFVRFHCASLDSSSIYRVTFQTSLAAMVLFILLHAIYLRLEQFRLL
jgi:hypothetical protein